MSGQLHALGALLPGGESLVTNSVIGWVGPREGMDDLEKKKFFYLSQQSNHNSSGSNP